MISLMRDTGVKIEGRSATDKLTHSYAYGGVGLLINTINDNFGLDIQRFVMLDFGSSSGIIDMVGTIVPTKCYFKDGKVKFEIGLARGKKNFDKRDSAAEKTAKRDIDRAMKDQRNRS